MLPIQTGVYHNIRPTTTQFLEQELHSIDPDTHQHKNTNLTHFSSGKESPILSQIFFNTSDKDQNLTKKEEKMNNDVIHKKMITKAERRAEHNAIERARRESLNIKLQSLAQILPNVNNYGRLSKSQIVEKALDWIKQSITKEKHYRYQIACLQNENQRILSQDTPREQLPRKECHGNIPVSALTSIYTMSNNMPPSNSSFNTTTNWSDDLNLADTTIQMCETTYIEKPAQQILSLSNNDKATAISSTYDEAEYQSSLNTILFIGNDLSNEHIENQRQAVAPILFPIELSDSQAHIHQDLINH